MSEQPKCAICGEPMPPGEEMFKYHGYSGDCPKPPLPRPTPTYDVECLKLANYFLRDETLTPQERIESAHLMAKVIQSAVEEFLRSRND